MLSEDEYVAPSGVRLRVETGAAGEATVLVEGEIDIASADDFASCLLRCIDGGRHRLRVDMAQVTFMDSTGLKALLNASKAVAEEGEVVVKNPSPIVRRVLTITAVDRIVRIDPVIEDTVTNGSPETG